MDAHICFQSKGAALWACIYVSYCNGLHLCS